MEILKIENMEKITKQEVDDFRNMYNKFDNLVDEIINYIISKKYVRYLTGFGGIKDFGYLSCDTNTFDIRIECQDYEVNDYCFIEIPWEHVYNDTWKEYIDELVREDIEKEKARQQKIIQQREEHERQELKRLLEKYGKQETV